MATDASVVARLDELLVLFHRRSLDLPDGLFDRRTAFVLNGAAFETMLGKSQADPLILMLTRGPAGYRFAAKALQHAVPDARLELGTFEMTGDAETAIARGRCRLYGHLRGTEEPIDDLVDIELHLTSSGSVAVASATFLETNLARLREARLRP
jgi:hypothetical protein